MSKAKTGRLARTLTTDLSRAHLILREQNHFFQKFILNNQLIPKTYYPVTGAWPRRQNRRMARREKAQRGGSTSESSA